MTNDSGFTTAFHDSEGPARAKDFVLKRDYDQDAKSSPIAYSDFPKEFQSKLDDFASSLFEADGGKVLITGNTQTGKTFLIEQLFFNRSRYLSATRLKELHFIRIEHDHASLVEENFPGGWGDVVDICTSNFSARPEELVFVTENLTAALRLSKLGLKTILEVSVPTLAALNQQESNGIVKQWGSWDAIDLNDFYFTKEAITKLVALNLLDKLNEHYEGFTFQRKHIQIFIKYAVTEGDLMLPEELTEGTEIPSKAIVVPPGVWARAFSKLAAIMALSTDVRNNSGAAVFTRAVAKVYEMFADTFEEFTELFFATDGPDHDDILASLTGGMGGVRLVHISQSSEEPDYEPAPAVATSYSDFSTLKERLSQEVLGQEEAIEAVVRALRIPAAGLNMDTRPLRSMLFLGPTGVGKTQLATTIAQELMDEPLSVKRIDMSEFGRDHEVSKLLGAPPGYVGHEAGGMLTNYVKKHPQAVIILDEVEKAHPKVWDSFLQLLDAGRLTDSSGDTVDFTKTLIIMTSNLGARELKRPVSGFAVGTPDDLYQKRKTESASIVAKAVEEFFKPELINRIDDQIIFNELPASIVRDVVAKEVAHLGERLEAQGYTLLQPEDDILDRLAELSDVSKYGAREVQRVVAKQISALLADVLLTGHEAQELALKFGDDKTIVVSAS